MDNKIKSATSMDCDNISKDVSPKVVFHSSFIMFESSGNGFSESRKNSNIVEKSQSFEAKTLHLTNKEEFSSYVDMIMKSADHTKNFKVKSTDEILSNYYVTKFDIGKCFSNHAECKKQAELVCFGNSTKCKEQVQKYYDSHPEISETIFIQTQQQDDSFIDSPLAI